MNRQFSRTREEARSNVGYRLSGAANIEPSSSTICRKTLRPMRPNRTSVATRSRSALKVLTPRSQHPFPMFDDRLDPTDLVLLES